MTLVTTLNRSVLSGHTGEALVCEPHPQLSDHLVTGSSCGKLFLWKLSAEDAQCLTGHTFSCAVVSGCFTSMAHFASACGDGTVKLWNVERGSTELTVKGKADAVVNCVKKLNDRQVMFGSDDGILRIADCVSGKVVRQSKFRYPITALDWSPKSGTVFVGSVDGTVRALDLCTLHEELSLPAHGDIVTSVASHPSNRVVATTGMDGAAKLWDVSPYAATTDSRLRFQTPVDHGTSRILVGSCWSSDGSRVVCGGAAGTVTMVTSADYSVRSLRLEHSLCCSVAFTQHGLCAGFQSGTVVLDRSI
jgi:WD40 repeat protein